MWDYIVLGQIPGTQIQVSFETWLSFSICLIAGYTGAVAARFIKSNQVVLALRVRHVLQTAAYTEWLLTRRHIQA